MTKPRGHLARRAGPQGYASKRISTRTHNAPLTGDVVAQVGHPQLGWSPPALRARIASKRALALFRACLPGRLAGPEPYFTARLQTRRTTTASIITRRSRSMDFGWQFSSMQFAARGEFGVSRQPLLDAQERARPPAPHQPSPATGFDGQLGHGQLGGRLLVLLLLGLKHQWS